MLYGEVLLLHKYKCSYIRAFARVLNSVEKTLEIDMRTC